MEEEEYDFTDIVENPSKEDEGDFDFSDVVEDPTPKEYPVYERLRRSAPGLVPFAKLFEGAGKAIYSGVTDQIPQSIAQTIEVGKSSLKPTNINEFIRTKKPVDFQKYVRGWIDSPYEFKGDPKYSGVKGFFTFFNMDEALEKYGKQFMEDSGLGAQVDEMNKNLPEVTERRKNLEAYVNLQKKEAQDKLKGVTQDYRDIKSVEDLGSFIGSLSGQAASQVPLSVATRGLSSYVMEAASVYDKQLDKLAQDNGISREQVIERNLDSPVAGQTYALLAGALDASSASTLIKGFRTSGGSLLKKMIVKAAPTIEESVTEATQGGLEDIGAGYTGQQAFVEHAPERINEVIGGAVGGGMFSFFGKAAQKEIADKTINEVADTGNPSINSLIDAEAMLTPAEEEVLKTKKAEERLEEVTKHEEKLIKEEEKVAEDKLKENKPDAKQTTKEETPVEESKTNEQDNTVSETSTTEEEIGTIVPKEGETSQVSSPSVTNENYSTENEVNAPDQEFNETPEYIAADQKVKDLAEAVRNSPTAENGKALNEAIQERDNARIEFEKKPSRKERQEPIVVNNPAQALKEQIKQHYKTLEEGVKKGQKMTNENLISKATDILKKASKNGIELTNNQVKSILTKVKNTNLFTQSSVSKLSNYIDNVYNDADYTTKVDNARSLNKKLRKASKASSSNIQSIKGLAKSFAKLDPTDTFINEHLRVGTQLLNALSSPKNEDYAAVDQAYVQDYINKKLEEVQEEENEAKETTAADDSDLRDKLSVSLANLKTKDLSEFDGRDKQIISDIRGLDPAKLNKEQIIRAIRVADNIVENDDLTNEAQVETDAQAQKALTQLEPIFKNLKLTNASFYSKLTNNVARAWDRLTNDSRKSAMIKRIIGQQDLVNAGSVVENMTNKASKEAEVVLDKFKKETKTDFLDIDNRVKTYVYALFVRHPQGSDPNSHLPQIKKNIEQTIEEYKIYGDDITADAWQKAYDEVKDFDTLEGLKTVWEAANPAHKKVFDHFTNLFSTITDEHAENTQQVHNKAYVRENDYTSMDTTNLNGKRPSFVENVQNLAGTKVKAEQSVTSLKAGRKLSPGSAYDTDWVANQLKAYQGTLYDIKASKTKMLLDKIITDTEFVKMMGRENAELVQRQTKRIDETNKGLGGLPSDEFLKVLSSGTQIAREIGAAYALGSFSQTLKQSAPVLAKGIAYHISQGSIPHLIKSLRFRSPGVEKLHNMYPIGTVGLRLGGVDRGDSTSYSLSEGSTKKAAKFFEGLYRGVQKNVRRSLGALTASDRVLKQAMWNSFYTMRLSELGEKSVNMSDEYSKQDDPKRKEAAAFAEHMISTTQIPSNPGELNVISRPDSNQAGRIVKNVLLPFASYSIEAKARLMVDLKKAWKRPTSENIVGGVGGDLAELATFAAIQYYVMNLYKDGLDVLWRELFGFDDPEEDEEKKDKQRKNSVLVNGINTVNPLAIGTPGEEASNFIMNKVAHSLYKINENTDITYKQWKRETGGFAYEGQNDAYGLISLGYKPIQGTAQNIMEFNESGKYDPLIVEDDYGHIDNVYLDKNERRFLLVNGMLESMSLLGINEADLFNSARRVKKQMLKDAQKRSK